MADPIKELSNDASKAILGEELHADQASRVLSEVSDDTKASLGPKLTTLGDKASPVLGKVSCVVHQDPVMKQEKTVPPKMAPAPQRSYKDALGLLDSEVIANPEIDFLRPPIVRFTGYGRGRVPRLCPTAGMELYIHYSELPASARNVSLGGLYGLKCGCCYATITY